MKCLVEGCKNYSDAGTTFAVLGNHQQFVLCAPCHEMLTTGKVHHAGITFIHDMGRVVRGVQALAIKHNEVLNRFWS